MSREVRHRLSRVAAIVILIAAVFAAVIYYVLSLTTGKTACLRYLNSRGISGINSANTINASYIRRWLTMDIVEDTRFLLVRVGKRDYEDLLSKNGFKKDTLYGLPSKEAGDAQVPDWWNPPDPTAACYGKVIGDTRIAVKWWSNAMYVFILN